MASAVAAALGPDCGARLTLLAQDSRLSTAPAGRDLRVARLGDPMDIADAVVFCAPPGAARDSIGALIRDVGARAARACPKTVLIIAAERSLALAQEAARVTGLDPALVLAAGGLPFAAHERARIAARHDLSPSQIQVIVIGADQPSSLRILPRYTRAACIPQDALGSPSTRRAQGEWTGATADALARAAVDLARAVIQDRREVFCCGAHSGDALGLPGGWITAPVRVGAVGAGEALPIGLTVEERMFLNSVAGLP